MIQEVIKVEKKNNIIIIIAIILLLALIIFLIINNKEEKSLEELTFDQIQEKVEKKEDFVLILSQTTCSHCANYKPTARKVANKYNIAIYYLDYDKYDESTMNEILEYFNFDGATPLTLFFKEGKEISLMSRISGDVSESRLVSTLKEYEYIENE